MISIKKILIITGFNSFPIIKKLIKPITDYDIDIYKANISISAFLSELMTDDILRESSSLNYDLILLPGFVQWDTTSLEKKWGVNIRKGPEFASDLPMTIKHLKEIILSNKIPANKLFEISGEGEYKKIIKENINYAKEHISNHTFYINNQKSDLLIGRNLPPPIIAEIVNCTEKSDENILNKVNHYIESGADVIDIGCVSNKPNHERVKEIITLIRKNYNVLLSIDSMDKNEIMAAVNNQIDLILSFDMGNYKDFLDIPKDIPIVILPTNMREAYFPKEPEERTTNLLKLTKILREAGFKKLIADPLLETPIAPGICNSLDSYFLYKKKVSFRENSRLELPLFFGISNVVELMDIDSVGINGLLASIAIELDMGILFTVEHSTKLMGGVAELKKSIKLNYIAKNKKTPPINQGIHVFKAKGKTSQEVPEINENNAINVDHLDPHFLHDNQGYFKIYINHYKHKIYALHFSNDHQLLNTLIGNNAEALSKKILKLNLTKDLYHINYIGRELKKAEHYLFLGKPYIQDE
ncbi:MAG: dihydropteroate synthase-like protein [Candidatus Hodarchaeota archaeon]